MRLNVWLILLLMFISVHARTANFLLVEHPEALKILNVYRQQLSEQEKRALGQWLPFQLKEVTTLSDNVTRVLETRVLSQTYFLLLDENGQPLNLEQAGAAEWIYRAKLLMDTMQVLPGYQLPLLNPKTKKEMGTLKAGSWLVRVFKKGRQYFVSPVSSRPIFGFVSSPPQTVWKKVSQKEFKQSLAWKNFLENLQFLLTNKNSIYKKLYTYFSKEQSDQNAPQWQMKAEPDKVLLKFTQPELLKKWPVSTQFFLNEVEDLARQNHLKVARRNDFTLIIERSQK